MELGNGISLSQVKWNTAVGRSRNSLYRKEGQVSSPVYSALGRTRTLISTCGQVMRSEHISHPNKTRASLSHNLSVLKPPLIDPRAQSSFLSSIQRERERVWSQASCCLMHNNYICMLEFNKYAGQCFIYFSFFTKYCK